LNGTGQHSPWSAARWRAAVVALLPAGVAIVLAALLFGAGPWRFLPVWSDEVVYWNEAAVFERAGFSGGYITIQEEPARAEFTRFGPHGPVFAAFHGLIAKAFGWRPYSAFLVNLAVVTLAVFAWASGTNGGTSAGAWLVVATFWPLLLYLPTNMQEPTHFALAFLAALALAGDNRDRAMRFWTTVLLVAAALVRPSWSLLVLPLGWQRARRAGPRGIVVLLAVTVLSAGAAWSTFDALASPSPQNTRTLTRAWLDSPGAAAQVLVETASRNLRQYVAFREEAPQVILRYFIAAFVAALALRTFIAWRRGSPDPALETALLTIAPVLVLVVLAGEVESWRDFRVLAPHLLVALLVLVAHARRELWLWAATLLLLPAYYNGFVAFHHDRFTTDGSSIDAMHEATEAAMPFVPDAPPWTNTVIVHSDLLQYPLLGVPRGIGVSYVFDWSNLMPPVRSRYLLLRPSDEEQLAGKVRLAPLGRTPLGMLYRNEGAE
jgi:hypothetical protein